MAETFFPLYSQRNNENDIHCIECFRFTTGGTSNFRKTAKLRSLTSRRLFNIYYQRRVYSINIANSAITFSRGSHIELDTFVAYRQRL